MFTSPDKIFISLFGYDIYWYGLFLALGIIFSVLLSHYVAKKFYKQDFVIDFTPVILVVGIIFARLYYCLINWNYYSNFPAKILFIREGGISIHGAIIGGILTIFCLWFLSRKFDKSFNLSFLQVCDIFAIGLPLGQAIGRWGNFFNSEAFGLPTNLPWKLYIAPQYRPEAFLNFEYFHPTFLYESILDIVVFAFLILMFKKYKADSKGQITALYLILYAVCRFFIEFLRTDSVLNFGILHIAQIASIIMFSIGISILIYIKYKK